MNEPICAWRRKLNTFRLLVALPRKHNEIPFITKSADKDTDISSVLLGLWLYSCHILFSTAGILANNVGLRPPRGFCFDIPSVAHFMAFV